MHMPCTCTCHATHTHTQTHMSATHTHTHKHTHRHTHVCVHVHARDACMPACRAHHATHIAERQLPTLTLNQLRTSPSLSLSSKTRSSMTMEESLGAALVRRRVCAAPGGAKADAPPRSMSRGETIRAATMSDTLPARYADKLGVLEGQIHAHAHVHVTCSRRRLGGE